MNVTRRIAFIVFILAVFLAVALSQVFKWDAVAAWLAAVNAIAFLTYGYDKLVAGTGRVRVPERVLIWLAFTGGSPAAFIGMRLFRHKVTKTSFQRAFWLVAIGQAVMVGLYFFWIQPWLGRI